MSELAPGWDCHVHVFDADLPTRAGHYRPAHRPLAMIEAEAATLGCGHLVLVQPSVYGSDNTLLLQALRQQPGRHRGVVVLDDAALADAAALDGMHAAGVRGARLNCVSPVGEDAPDLAARFGRLAPCLRERGWHLQWYARPEQLPTIATLHAQAGAPPAVLDHLAGLTPGLPAAHPAWQALAVLAGQGAWLKLSGWYRLGAAAPYAALRPLVQRAAALFGERLVWGSDWPHTSFPADQMPRYASTWQPVPDALGTAEAGRLRDRQPAIYR